MNNKKLYYALELSESLSFSQVAAKLGISQPALSKQISGLEKELGVTLFDRSKNPIELTAAGDYFLRESKELLYRQEQLYRSMEDFKDGKKGKLVIGVSPFRSLYLLPEICKKVKEKYPDVKIILNEEARSENLRLKAVEGRYDFAIANLPVDESSLDVVLIEQDKLVLAVPENMVNLIKGAKDANKEIDFKDCTDLPFIVVGKNQEMKQIFEKFCNVSDINPKIAMEVVGLSTAWAMARSGIGATLLPMQFVKSMGDDKNLSLFIPKYQTIVRQPAVIMKRGQYLSEYAKYAIELLSVEK